MSAWKGECENVISGGDSCRLSHGSNRGQQAQSSFLVPKSQSQIDGRKLSKGLGPVFQDTEPPQKSVQRNGGKLGSNCTVTCSKGTWHHIEIWERKGPSRGVTHKCEHQERCARREAWDLATHVCQLRTKDKATFYFPTEAWLVRAPLRRNQRMENLW